MDPWNIYSRSIISDHESVRSHYFHSFNVTAAYDRPSVASDTWPQFDSSSTIVNVKPPRSGMDHFVCSPGPGREKPPR
jgi:hypothetical protein